MVDSSLKRVYQDFYSWLILYYGCVAQLVEQRSPKSPVGGSNPSALDKKRKLRKLKNMSIMDLKLSETSSGGEASDSSTNQARKSLFVFLYEMKEELKKVSWTSKEDLTFSTKMVLLSTFVLGFSVYLVDLSVRGLLEMIKTSVHVIFG